MRPKKPSDLSLISMTRNPALLTLLFTLATASLAVAQDAVPPPPPVETSSTSLLDLYQQGGWTMHILLLFSVCTVGVAVYCVTQVTQARMVPKPLMDTLTTSMQKRDVGGAYQICLAQPNSLSRVISNALLKVNFDRDQANKSSMEDAAGETMDGEETRYMTWINYLNVFATIAPMIGLFGTVSGMITAFNKLKMGASEPSDLAGGIGEAMITTAGGLIVGIPAMFFFFFFRNKLMGIMAELQRSASFLIGVLSGEVKLAGGEPANEAVNPEES
jgi:biopolymer transport protein ExbB